jgi:hypothetical protein
MYIELIRDRLEIINAIGDEEVNDIIRLLRSGERNPDHLDCLSVLCKCGNVAVGEQQTRITRLLLAETMANQCLYETRFLQHGEVQVRTRPNAPWVDLKE